MNTSYGHYGTRADEYFSSSSNDRVRGSGVSMTRPGSTPIVHTRMVTGGRPAKDAILGRSASDAIAKAVRATGAGNYPRAAGRLEYAGRTIARMKLATPARAQLRAQLADAVRSLQAAALAAGQPITPIVEPDAEDIEIIEQPDGSGLVVPERQGLGTGATIALVVLAVTVVGGGLYAFTRKAK